MKIEKLSPAFKDYLWGGTKLRTIYKKNCDFEKVAESWELSTHSAGESVISGGEFDGLNFSEYFNSVGKEVLGKNCADFENFPVLIKFIDAKEPLSIQVHPNDEYALRVEGEYGKTEMWYIVDCDEDSYLYFGVNKEISKEEMRKKIEDNTVLDVLNKVNVNKGDVFFINAGTIHAIGAGIVICEIQQNSNTTYRLYDFARRGADGSLRELHIDKSLDVAVLSPSDTADLQEKSEIVEGASCNLLGKCKYFTSKKYEVGSVVTLNIDENSFASLIIVDGSGKICGSENEISFKVGDSLFVPASSGKVTISGKCTFIETRV